MVGDIAHVFNRGVEKRKVFLSEEDYLRFAESLYLLNNIKGKIRTEKNIFNNSKDAPRQEKLVEIMKWCLLPNHYHLLLFEVSEGGIIEFTKRLGNSYTKYFNTKHKGRSGYLFQNSARIKVLETEQHFLYIPFYIDLNPLDLNKTGQDTLTFLKSYRWSNFSTYYNENMFSLISQPDFFYEQFDTRCDKYEKELLNLSTWQVDELEEEMV